MREGESGEWERREGVGKERDRGRDIIFFRKTDQECFLYYVLCKFVGRWRNRQQKRKMGKVGKAEAPVSSLI